MATDEQFRRVRRMLKEGADQQAEGAFRMGAVWAARELGHPLDDDLVERGLRWYKLARARWDEEIAAEEEAKRREEQD